MNKNYWIYCPEYVFIKGPYTIREAMREKGVYDSYDTNVVILKTIIGYDGKEVK